MRGRAEPETSFSQAIDPSFLRRLPAVDVALRLTKLLARRRSGFSLPQAFYTDEEIFRLDLDRVFRARWLFAGYT